MRAPFIQSGAITVITLLNRQLVVHENNVASLGSMVLVLGKVHIFLRRKILKQNELDTKNHFNNRSGIKRMQIKRKEVQR